MAPHDTAASAKQADEEAPLAAADDDAAELGERVSLWRGAAARAAAAAAGVGCIAAAGALGYAHFFGVGTRQAFQYVFWMLLGRWVAERAASALAVLCERSLAETDRVVYFLLALSGLIKRSLASFFALVAWGVVLGDVLEPRALLGARGYILGLRLHGAVLIAALFHLIARGCTTWLALHFQAANQWASLREALRTEYFVVALSESSSRRRSRERAALRNRVLAAVRASKHDAGKSGKDRGNGIAKRISSWSSFKDEPAREPAASPAQARTSCAPLFARNGADAAAPRSPPGSEATTPRSDAAVDTLPVVEGDDGGVLVDAETARAVAANPGAKPRAMDVSRAAEYLSSQGYLTVSGALRESLHSGKGAGSRSAHEIRSRVEASSFAKRLFDHVRMRGAVCVLQRDFEDFLPKDLAGQAFRIFDQKGLGVLYEADFDNAILDIYGRRRGLARTLRDASEVVASIGRLIISMLLVVYVFAVLGIFGLSMSNLWLIFSSLIVATGFAFGTTVQNVLDSVTTLVFAHPMDVNDWIVYEGEKYSVFELGLRHIGLRNLWGVVTYLPTHRLANAEIMNLSRATTCWDTTDVIIDMALTATDVVRLEEALRTFLASDPSTFLYDTDDDFSVLVGSMEPPMKLKLAVYYRLAFSPAELMRKSRAKSRLIFTLQHFLVNDLGVSWTDVEGAIRSDMTLGRLKPAAPERTAQESTVERR